MLLIVPGCDAFNRALIANALSSIAYSLDKENLILDFSVPGTEAFWSLYKGGIKYFEDIISILSGISPKMMKSFLSSGGNKNLVLGLKNKNIEELPLEDIIYLLSVLKENYKYIFIIMPDELGENAIKILEKAKSVLMPFLSDSISSQKAVIRAENLLSSVSTGLNLIPLKLECGYEFHSEKILNKYEIFKNCLSADFSLKVQDDIYSPKYSYRNNSSLVNTLSEILKRHEQNEIKKLSLKESAANYYRTEKAYQELREKIHIELVEKMKEFADESDTLKLKKIARSKIEEILNKMKIDLPKDISDKLFKELCDDVAGLGILEDLLADPAVTEIMVNGPDNIYIEKAGKIIESETVFPDENRLKTVIDRIVSPIGRHIDEASPIVDARLKDGSRVNAVIRPISLIGPVLTIRKFLKNKLSTEELISAGSMSKEMAEFLKAGVLLKRNIIISGGTGTGKTTLLNAVSNFIPSNERLITIEDSAELQLQQKHIVRLESRPKSTEGTGEINIRRLVVNALRMRPDRIIVGECRSGEALDMLQAMNTGHEGSMTTVHSNSAKDAIARLVSMVMMSGADLPERSIISQIAAAISIIVQLTRYSDGTRKVSSISVLNKTDDDRIYEIKPVFEFQLQGIEKGIQKGNFIPSGYIPDFIKKASQSGVNVNMEIFKCH